MFKRVYLVCEKRYINVRWKNNYKRICSIIQNKKNRKILHDEIIIQSRIYLNEKTKNIAFDDIAQKNFVIVKKSFHDFVIDDDDHLNWDFLNTTINEKIEQKSYRLLVKKSTKFTLRLNNSNQSNLELNALKKTLQKIFDSKSKRNLLISIDVELNI